MQCGLLGRKLSHSYSPQIHGMLSEYSYGLFETEPESLADFLQSSDFTGLNVTIPYKKAVIQYCDTLSDCAAALGAVNTLVRRDGKLIGHNTDYYGFKSMVEKCGVSVNGKKALVLGSGGASATVKKVLEDMGAFVIVISRTGPNHYGNLHLHTDAQVIVNATPVGMYPDVDACPIDISIFDMLECVLDLIYNPANTRLLQSAQARNIPCENGLWMLVAQAKESSEWFTGQKIPDEKIGKIYRAIRAQMENIVLIGMPGCGKSTIGRELAVKLGKGFVDTDAEIERKAQMPIPKIFENHGEAYFRQLETEAIACISKQSGAVIATGGGCVTRPENYPHLHQNSTIIWLQRDLSLLPTEGRPLSQSNRLESLLAARAPLYADFSDIRIDNNGASENTIQHILDHLQEEYQ